ncbi:hypothetical protein [Kitasatospora sp. NPDC101183]|uniref:hypothetical protein n=1 Tax=Kitasatospora sp. NPDC101183 TaxID=3364100 RepID=UPI003801D7BA
MRALRLASAVAATAVLIGGATACSSSSKGGDQKAGSTGDAAAPAAKPDADPKAALVASTLVMQKFGNGKVQIKAVSDNAPATGDDHWDNPAKTAVDVTSNEGGKPFHVRIVGTEAYLGADAFGDKAPAGKSWVKLSASNPLGAGLQTAALMVNPVVQLTVAAQSGKLTVVGQEDVDGGKATHIRAVEDTAVLLAGMKGLSPEQHAAIQKELENEGKTLTVDFWINDKHELVKLQEHGDAKAAEETTVTYSGLGKAAPIQAPAAKDVGEADLSKLLG